MSLHKFNQIRFNTYDIIKGPFRAPEDVRYQRYRPLKPSLRCETDYFATEKMREELKLQEWVDRIHDDK